MKTENNILTAFIVMRKKPRDLKECLVVMRVRRSKASEKYLESVSSASDGMHTNKKQANINIPDICGVSGSCFRPLSINLTKPRPCRSDSSMDLPS